MNGPWGLIAYLPDGSRDWIISRGEPTTVTFRRGGQHRVVVLSSPERLFLGSMTESDVVVGSVYTAVSPVRVLDTRSALGVPTSTPVAAGADVTLPINMAGLPDEGDISAVVLNVTTAAPTAAGSMTVYPGGQGLPAVSNLNFTAGQSVANLVTVPMNDGSVVFHNGSAGTVHVIADFEGYYAGSRDGFASMNPVRVLDTRSAIGVAGRVPVASHATLTLDLSSALPAVPPQWS